MWSKLHALWKFSATAFHLYYMKLKAQSTVQDPLQATDQTKQDTTHAKPGSPSNTVGELCSSIV